MNEEDRIDTIPMQDLQGKLIGYACEGSEKDENVETVATSFYFGLQYPIGQQAAAVEYINQALLEHVAKEYDLLSGAACDVLDPSRITIQSRYPSPLVSIESKINPVDLFQSCQKQDALFNPNLQDCQISQLLLKGGVWNAEEMPDVIATVEEWLQQDSSSSFSTQPLSNNNSNNPYSIHYLGGQELEDQMVISTGAGRPNYPAAQTGMEEDGVTTNRNQLTGLYELSPFGIAFLCLLVMAFVLLIAAFLRKQQLQKLADEERTRQEEEKEQLQRKNSALNLIVPEIDVKASSSAPSTKEDDSHFSMTDSISAMSA